MDGVDNAEGSKLIQGAQHKRDTRVATLRAKLALRERNDRSRVILFGICGFSAALVVLLVLYVLRYVGVSQSFSRLRHDGVMWTTAGEVRKCQGVDSKIKSLQGMVDHAVSQRDFLNAGKYDAEIIRLRELCAEYRRSHTNADAPDTESSHTHDKLAKSEEHKATPNQHHVASTRS